GDLAHVPWRSGDSPVAARDVVQPLEDDPPRGLRAPPGPLVEPAISDEREDAVRLEGGRRALEREAPAARVDLDRVGVHLTGRDASIRVAGLARPEPAVGPGQLAGGRPGERREPEDEPAARHVRDV